MPSHLHAPVSQQVPELEADFAPQPDFSLLLERVEAGQKLLGKAAAIPIVVGECSVRVLMCRTGEG